MSDDAPKAVQDSWTVVTDKQDSARLQEVGYTGLMEHAAPGGGGQRPVTGNLWVKAGHTSCFHVSDQLTMQVSLVLVVASSP